MAKQSTKALDHRDALRRLLQMEADAAVIRDRLESEAQLERDERVAATRAATVQEFESTHRKNLDLQALTKEPLERIASAASTFEREILASIDDLSDACERYNESVGWYNRKRHILGSEERHRTVYLDWIVREIADKLSNLTLSGRDDHHFSVRLHEAGGAYGAAIKVTLNRIAKLSPSLFRR